MIETTLPGLILMFLVVFCMYMAIMSFIIIIFKFLDNHPDSNKPRRKLNIKNMKEER